LIAVRMATPITMVTTLLVVGYAIIIYEVSYNVF
jgi:hypothetical protein